MAVQAAMLNEDPFHFILNIRGKPVMLDKDLAELYGVETRALLQAVRRNADRFPADFAFPLELKELSGLRSQIVISNKGRGGNRYMPYAFTEQGIAMLSSVLRSKRAAEVNVGLMRAFVRMRKLTLGYSELVSKVDSLEKKYAEHDGDIKSIFDAIRQMVEIEEQPKRRIGFARDTENQSAKSRLNRKLLLKK
jgi:hypothetical protein